MKGYPGSLVKMNEVVEVASDWKGNRREKKEASNQRGESYSEGREDCFPAVPPCHRLTAEEENKRETLTVTHILKRLNFIIKTKKKRTIYMTILLKGYECTKILIANFLMGLKGVRMYRAEVALNREIAFPLFNTIKV